MALLGRRPADGANRGQAPTGDPAAPGLGQTLLVGTWPCRQVLPPVGGQPRARLHSVWGGLGLRSPRRLSGGRTRPGAGEPRHRGSWDSAPRSPFSSQWPVLSFGGSHRRGGRLGEGSEGAPRSRAARPRSLCVFGTRFPTSLPRLPFPLSLPLTQVPVEYPAIST